jgi:hypothetical protein
MAAGTRKASRRQGRSWAHELTASQSHDHLACTRRPNQRVRTYARVVTPTPPTPTHPLMLPIPPKAGTHNLALGAPAHIPHALQLLPTLAMLCEGLVRRGRHGDVFVLDCAKWTWEPVLVGNADSTVSCSPGHLL